MSPLRLTAAGILACIALPAIAQPFAAELVADFDQGLSDLSSPTQLNGLTSLGDKAVYAWNDGLHGSEPWVSDGTDGGTRLLADLCPGVCSSLPYFVSASTGLAFFLANTGTPELVLHSTDGVTVRRHGASRQRPGLVFGDSYYFIDYPVSGTPFELWRVSGASGEKTRLTVFPDGSDLPTLESAGEMLFVSTRSSLDVLFPGDDELHRIGPWRGSNFVRLANGLTVFRASENPFPTGRPPAPQSRLWVTDGTAAGTRGLDGPSFYSAIFGLGATAYVVDPTGIVYQTDGQSVAISADLAMPGGAPYELLGATPLAVFYTANGRLFSFVPGTGRHQLSDDGARLLGTLADGRAILVQLHTEFFVSDGSPAGTRYLGTVFNLRETRASTAGGLLFQAYFGSSELWRTDGASVASFSSVKPQPSSHPRPFEADSRLYAETALPHPARNLFELAPAGPTPIGAANYEVLGTLPSGLLLRERATRRAFFYGDDVLQDLQVAGIENPSRTTADGRIYFTDAGLGQKLRESDGTLAGTRVLVDSRPSFTRFCGVIPLPPEECYPDFPYQIEPSGNKIFFVADLADDALTAMAYDRQANQLVQLTTDSGVYAWLKITALPDGKAAFLRFGEVHGDVFPFPLLGQRLELWISDGTAAGTTRRLEIFPEAALLPGQELLFAVGERVFFRVPQTDHDELWTSHPTTGTSKLADFLALGFEKGKAMAAGERMLFQAATAAHGSELWQSDGTAAGTRLAFDLAAGAKSSNPQALTALGDGRFAFAADNGVVGHELWISDGSAAGTHLLADIAPGYASGSPSHLLLTGDLLYFQAGRQDIGRELFRVTVPPPPPPCPTDKVCLRGGRFEASIEVKTPIGQIVKARRVFAADAAGMFSFFNESNWEMMVKVLDGCALNGQFWVFAAAATDLEHTLTVKDLDSGAEKAWTSPAGPAAALTDTAAFPCGPLPGN